MKEGRLLELDGARLEQFMLEHPSAAARLLHFLMEEMAQRLRRVDERLIEVIFWGGLRREPAGEGTSTRPKFSD